MKKLFVFLLISILCFSCKEKDDEVFISWDVVNFSNSDIISYVQQELVDSVCHAVAEENGFIKKGDRKYLIPTDDIVQGTVIGDTYVDEVVYHLGNRPGIYLQTSYNENVTGRLNIAVKDIQYYRQAWSSEFLETESNTITSCYFSYQP
ncbi:MAG: hypothetical protein MJ001_02400 [Paludibacteraceae bacterium]|nr:hypothetical protein [Paludibacteraceae bacterium]